MPNVSNCMNHFWFTKCLYTLALDTDWMVVVNGLLYAIFNLTSTWILWCATGWWFYKATSFNIFFSPNSILNEFQVLGFSYIVSDDVYKILFFPSLWFLSSLSFWFFDKILAVLIYFYLGLQSSEGSPSYCTFLICKLRNSDDGLLSKFLCYTSIQSLFFGQGILQWRLN